MPENKDDTQVAVSAFGNSLVAKGTNGIIIVVLIAALGGVIYLVLNVLSERTRLSTEEHIGIIDSISGIKGANDKIGDLIEEQNYIILSDEKEKADIKRRLKRPPSLSKKLRENGE